MLDIIFFYFLLVDSLGLVSSQSKRNIENECLKMSVTHNNYITDVDNTLLKFYNITVFLLKIKPLKVILTYTKSYMHTTCAFY